MRYADPFRDAGRPETTDRDFLLTCSCGTEQRLDEMTLDEGSAITLYECVRCTKSIVAVMTDDPDLQTRAPESMTRLQERAGHHLRGYVIASRVDVALRPGGAARDILLIYATPNFWVRYLHV